MMSAPPQLDQLKISTSAGVFVDNVLPTIKAWRAQSDQVALITFVNREGTAPRPIGAQMAVSDKGESVGYIASDCLGQAIIQEAQRVIETKSTELVRYGKGSKYIDLKLPCGSGIDLYFDGTVSDKLFEQMFDYQDKRQAFSLTLDVSTGASSISANVKGTANGFDETNSNLFHRHYLPTPRIFIAGTGLNLIYLAQFAAQTGFETKILSHDEQACEYLQSLGLPILPQKPASSLVEQYTDPYTAAVIMFHDHDLEGPILMPLLESDCYYIGAMGSKTTHENRLLVLQSQGVSEANLARLKGSIGTLPTCKNPPQMALSILTEVMQDAQQRNLIC